LITADGTSHPLRASPTASLPEALVTNFLMKPPRFRELAAQGQLFDAPARLTDATIEFAKGFAIWDLAPGHYILHAAGGSVIDLNGQPLPLDQNLDSLTDIAEAMDRRQTFIAAANPDLAAHLLKVIQRTRGRASPTTP